MGSIVFFLHAQWKERADYLDSPHLIHLENHGPLAHYITYNNGFHWQDDSAVSDLLYESNEVTVMHWHHNQLQLYGSRECGKQS